MHVDTAVNVLLERSELTVRRAGVFAYRKHYNYPVRRFADYDLVLIGRGKGHWLIEGLGEVPVGPGTILLLPPNVANGTPGRQLGSAEHVGIHFDLHLESGGEFFQTVPFEPVSRPQPWRPLYEQAARIAREWSGHEAVGRGIMVHDLTRALLVELVRLFSRNRRDPIATDGRVLEVLRRLDEQFAEPLTVADMGRWVGLSASHLRALFAEELGASPLHAMLSRRIGEARKLLLGSSLTVKEIAHQVGYDDQLYFSRAFRRAVGMSPVEYRESAKNP
ncbi:MAG TPA: hypothetical protein DCX07_00370 [Phycisphaerales bacterium]|nr:hypothetical protein [Phycisphaerales bacterium]